MPFDVLRQRRQKERKRHTIREFAVPATPQTTFVNLLLGRCISFEQSREFVNPASAGVHEELPVQDNVKLPRSARNWRTENVCFLVEREKYRPTDRYATDYSILVADENGTFSPGLVTCQSIKPLRIPEIALGPRAVDP